MLRCPMRADIFELIKHEKRWHKWHTNFPSFGFTCHCNLSAQLNWRLTILGVIRPYADEQKVFLFNFSFLRRHICTFGYCLHSVMSNAVCLLVATRWPSSEEQTNKYFWWWKINAQIAKFIYGKNVLIFQDVGRQANGLDFNRQRAFTSMSVKSAEKREQSAFCIHTTGSFVAHKFPLQIAPKWIITPYLPASLFARDSFWHFGKWQMSLFRFNVDPTVGSMKFDLISLIWSNLSGKFLLPFRIQSFRQQTTQWHWLVCQCSSL